MAIEDFIVFAITAYACLVVFGAGYQRGWSQAWELARRGGKIEPPEEWPDPPPAVR